MSNPEIENIEECYKCGCAYFEHEREDKILITQFLCKRCKGEIENDRK